jgi:hypothetical protein
MSAMKSTAAAAPAMPSWFSVPVSNLNGVSRSCVRRRRARTSSAVSRARTARRRAARRTCRPSRAGSRSPGRRRRSHRAARSARRRSRSARRPTRASSTTRATSLMVPTALLAQTTATILVRSFTSALEGVPVERAGRRSTGYLAHHDAAFLQREPGAAVGFVVELGDDDLVALASGRAEAVASRKLSVVVLAPKAHFVPVAAEKVGERRRGRRPAGGRSRSWSRRSRACWSCG